MKPAKRGTRVVPPFTRQPLDRLSKNNSNKNKDTSALLTLSTFLSRLIYRSISAALINYRQINFPPLAASLVHKLFMSCVEMIKILSTVLAYF